MSTVSVFRRAALALAVLLTATPAWAEAGATQLDGKLLGILWVVPFAGMLLSIAVLPLATPQLWHHHFGKISAGWALAVLGPMVVAFGFPLATHELLHTMMLEYVPFLILIGALFCVTGNIHLKGNLHGAPG